MDMEVDPRVQGRLNEERFFEIINRAISEGKAPSWFYSIRQANAAEDHAGIDGFAKIYQIHDQERPLTVPFQIKSSFDGVLEHLKQDRVFWVDALRYFIINPHVQDRKIAQQFFDELEKIRKSRETFDRLMRHVESLRPARYRRRRTSQERGRSR